MASEQFEEIIALLALLVALGIVGWSYGNVIAKAEKFGDYDKGKLFFALHAGINFWIFAALTLLTIIRVLCYIDQELFITLLVAGLGALGVNLTSNARMKKEDLPEPNPKKVEATNTQP